MALMDELGSRIKEFEVVNSPRLMKRVPVIIRVDGNNFSNYLRKAKRPLDETVHEAMCFVGQQLLEKVQGARLAYVQSDECSILVTDWDQYTTQSWVDYKIQKMASLTAGIATAAFNKKYCNEKSPGFFDSRCFNLPRHDVDNYFIWRQKDAMRNSVNLYGQTYLPKSSLFKMSNLEMIEALKAQKNIDWHAEEAWKRRGTFIYTAIRPNENNDLRRVFIREFPDVMEDRSIVTQFMTEPFWKERPDATEHKGG